jgi:hypothetical protein
MDVETVSILRCLWDLACIKQNSGAFNVLFAGTVAVSTVFYAILTFVLVWETRRLRKVQTEPKISVYIEPEERWLNLIDLVIKNIGQGPAYDLRFTCPEDFKLSPKREKTLSSLSFLRGIDYLAPEQRIRTFLTDAVYILGQQTARSFQITATYRNAPNGKGRGFQETFNIDFDQLRGFEVIGEPPLYSIAKNVKELKEVADLIASGSTRIKVELWSQEDLAEEERARLESFKQLEKEMEKQEGTST